MRLMLAKARRYPSADFIRSASNPPTNLETEAPSSAAWRRAQCKASSLKVTVTFFNTKLVYHELRVPQPPSSFRKNFQLSAAQVSQRKRRARWRPRAERSAHRLGEVNRRTRASRSSCKLRGSTSRAASPAISGSEETFEVTTGTPAAMACATGNPKPSYSDG